MIITPAFGDADQNASPQENTKKAAGLPATPQGSKDSGDGNANRFVWQTSPEPFGEPVDGLELLNELRDTFTRHIVLPDHAAPALALWTLHTYSFQLGDIATYLGLLSPEKRCGKTTALALLGKFCHRALPTSNVSPAAVYRVIEKWSPTLLVDEADSFVAGKEELRGILNAGYSRDTAYTLRCVGETYEPKPFNVFGPKVFAGIGRLPDTLGDRCIIVPMHRRLPGEKVERFRGDMDGSVVRQKCMRWTNDHQLEIQQADPEMPEELDDRAADIWRPLMAIADLAGGQWPILARKASVTLSINKDDEESISIRLLTDVRDYLKDNCLDRLSTRNLLDHLHSLDERPWKTLNRGREMTARQLADRLRRFKIHSKTIRFSVDTAKGYLWGDMQEAFERYTVWKNP